MAESTPTWILGTSALGTSTQLGWAFDLNAVLLAYLRFYYTSASPDLTTLARRYQQQVGGDATQAWRTLQATAIAWWVVDG